MGATARGQGGGLVTQLPICPDCKLPMKKRSRRDHIKRNMWWPVYRCPECGFYLMRAVDQ